MAQYKVIQDIEAEDKLVGPLTLRQFIYAGVAAICLYICFLAYSKGAGFLVGFFLPIAAVAGFFAYPWRGEQPTEIWALARVRFSIKPRVRIWDQDGAKDLVTVIAPKRIAMRHNSKADMSQNEVRSRLKALADTIDSRGWATRNAAYGIYSQQWNHPTVAPAPDAGGPLSAMIPNDDMFDEKSSVAQNFEAMLSKSQIQTRERVMQQMSQAQNPQPQQQIQPQPAYVQQPAPQYGYGMPQLPAPVMPATMPAPPSQDMSQTYATTPAAPAYDLPQPADPAQQYQQQAQSNAWFANGPAYPTNPSVVQPTSMPTMPAPTSPYRIESDVPLVAAATPTPEEASLAESIKQQNQSAMAINYGHMRVLQPAGDPYASSNGTAPIDYQASTQIPAPVYSSQVDSSSAPLQAAQPVTRQPDPAILDLANNDDLDIATIARQAKREIDKSPDEVEIRLH
jgi:hypothetical protein